MALITAELKDTGGEKALIEWVHKNQGFFNYYHLAFYWRKQNMPEKALDALRQAVQYSIEDIPEDCSLMHWFFGQEAAYYAYCKRDFPLAIALCERVEQLLAFYNESGYAVHAAAYLAKGDIEVARKYAELIMQLHDWQSTKYSDLLNAVMNSNQSFDFVLPKIYAEYYFWE